MFSGSCYLKNKILENPGSGEGLMQMWLSILIWWKEAGELLRSLIKALTANANHLLKGLYLIVRFKIAI